MNEKLFPQETKKEIIKELLLKETEHQQLPESIFILSGGTIKKDNNYKSPSYSETDLTGNFTGSKARIIAASHIGHSFPEIKLVTTSDSNPDHPSDASIMAKELTNLGISEEQIILEENSYSTATELMEMIKMSVEKNWSTVGIITNEYHIPRTEALLNALPDLIKDSDFQNLHQQLIANKTEISFISAETILENINPHYKCLIEKVKETEEYKNRLEAENQGLKDLQEGRYKISINPAP